MSQVLDRRRCERFRAVENRCFLTWEGDSGEQIAGGCLVNLSQTGALIFADVAPPARQQVSVRLHEPIPTGWVEAAVVGRSRSLVSRLTGRGTCGIRLRFLPGCRYALF